MTKARTIAEQTGDKRATPVSLYLFDTLLKVTEYSFDTRDRDFLLYFESRTGCYIGANPNNGQILDRIEKGLMQPLPADYFETQCRIANMSDADYEQTYKDSAKVNRLFKAKLQDCWELFTSKKPTQTRPQQTSQQIDLFADWQMA
jgi:hypothetical protein